MTGLLLYLVAVRARGPKCLGAEAPVFIGVSDGT
jgi:hypothetical protein